VLQVDLDYPQGTAGRESPCKKMSLLVSVYVCSAVPVPVIERYTVSDI